jgi:hypothetical protein
VFGATPHISGQSFAIAPGTLSDFSEVVNLGGVAARYVKIDVTSNHGDPSFTGLSEVNVVADTIEGVSAIAAKIHSVSSNLAGFNRKADYLVNRSGMFGEIHGIVPEGSMWLSQGTFNSAGELEVPDTSPEVTFDMGSVVDLHRMKVYNYNEYNEGHALEAQLLGRGVASMDVMVAGDDLNFTTLIAGLPVDVAPTAGDTIDIGQIVDLGGTSARYVKFVVLSNHNGRDFTDPLGDDTFDNFAGLSEVRFYAVPEPASAALAAMCLIAVAGFGRRRRQ